jgi:hypothetical protein
MPALAHITPATLKNLLILDGWQIRYEDTYNWILTKGSKDPLAIPKRVKLIPFEIHEHCMAVAELNHEEYFELLEKVRS